ncbi:UNVERIFIED_CONTAM: Retrovirus-related Pol polyprotein from transposon gypsy [Sesamum indicum]
MEEAGRNAIIAYVRKATAPAEKEITRRRIVKEREVERISEGISRRGLEPRRIATSSEVGSSSRGGSRRREPAISRAEVDSVGKQIRMLGKEIDEVKRRGELVSRNKNSPFCNKILTEVVNTSFRMPNLPKYDGTKDPQAHVATFDLVMNLYGQSSSINVKLFLTTLMGKAQEWCTSLPPRDNETLKNFMGRFNNETLEVQDLRIDMMVSILIHGLKKGSFASALARDPPMDVEQLMRLSRYRDSRRGEGDKRQKFDKGRDPPYQPKYHNYIPLNTTRAKALMMVEKTVILQWPRHTRFTPSKKLSSKYCKFYRERGHDTEDCFQLKDEIERLVRQGYFKDLILRGREMDNRALKSISRSREREPNVRDNVPVKGVIHTIAGRPEQGDSRQTRKRYERINQRTQLVMNMEPEEEIVFENKDAAERTGPQNDPMVIKMDIANFTVHKLLVDNGSSADIIFRDVLVKIRLDNSKLEPVRTPLVGFGGTEVESLGTIDLPVSLGEELKRKILMVKFLVVDTPFAYNKEAQKCYNLSLKKDDCSDKKRKLEDPSEGVDPEMIVHCLDVDLTTRPVQQKKRNFITEKNQIVKEEVQRLLKAGYVSELVPKASGKWRVCIDFTNLKKTCPKDPYPLQRIDALVDLTTGYELFSMMDAYQGYHQIFMAEEDRSKTSFVTEGGIYCYNVMPFDLKNAGATYQRLVNKTFKEQIGKLMEVYIDDMLVKSSRSRDHLLHLKQAFTIMRTFRMKLNPTKCTFGVVGGKFLRYMVSERGIQANPGIIEAILKLKSPTMIKQVQKLTGKLASLNRFSSRSLDRNLPSSRSNPKENEILYLYLAVSENTVSSVLVRENEGVQNPIYYVSKMVQGAEKRYTEIKKLALALVVTARKLLVKWAVELGEYDIEHQARAAEKAQVLADFVIELSSEPESSQEIGKWILHVDGSSNASLGGAGILIQGTAGVEIEVAARLSFPTTNNEAEHEALILELELASEVGEKDLEVYTDPLQIEGTYKTKERAIILYHKKAKSLMARFYRCQILCRSLAMLSGIQDRKITMMVKDKSAITKEVEANAIRESSAWKDGIVEYLRDGVLPSDPSRARRLKSKAACFTLVDTQLYKRTIERPLLKCLDADRTEYVMTEIHEESYGNHSGGQSLAQKGYQGTHTKASFGHPSERILHHKGLMLKSYNQKLKPKQLQVGDLVLKRVQVSRHVGKLMGRTIQGGGDQEEGHLPASRYAWQRSRATLEHQEPQENLRLIMSLEKATQCKLD